MSYLIITKKGGGYFKKYTPNSKTQFYAHKEKTLNSARKSVKNFLKKGIHAKIYKNWKR